MMKSDKRITILITAIVISSVFAAIPVTQATPAPDEIWVNTDSSGDVTDVAIGDLTGNGIDDVAFIDHQPQGTVFAVYGDNGTEYWNESNVSGFSIAVGDVDGMTRTRSSQAAIILTKVSRV